MFGHASEKQVRSETWSDSRPRPVFQGGVEMMHGGMVHEKLANVWPKSVEMVAEGVVGVDSGGRGAGVSAGERAVR